MSLLKLNIYNNKGQIKKTYTTDNIFVTTRMVEKLFKLVDIDDLLSRNLTTELTEEETKKLGATLFKIILKNWEDFKQVIINIFEGITLDEIEDTKIDELITVILTILTTSLNSLNNVGGKSKN